MGERIEGWARRERDGLVRGATNMKQKRDKVCYKRMGKGGKRREGCGR